MTPEEALKPMEQIYIRDAKLLAHKHGYQQLDSERFEQQLKAARQQQPAQSQTPERLGNREAFISNLKSVREKATQRLSLRH